MKRVKISELKAHLSQYINEVRDGETIIVCDRNRPVVELNRVADGEAGLDGTQVRFATTRMPPLSHFPRIPLSPGPTAQELLADIRRDKE
jgi:prevent-host-death family protein